MKTKFWLVRVPRPLVCAWHSSMRLSSGAATVCVRRYDGLPSQCTTCGLLVVHCDEHAARTILWRGQRLLGLAGMGDACREEPRSRGTLAHTECHTKLA